MSRNTDRSAANLFPLKSDRSQNGLSALNKPKAPPHQSLIVMMNGPNVIGKMMLILTKTSYGQDDGTIPLLIVVLI